jgi:hypothetical protein
MTAWINRLLGYRHWFSVRVAYRSPAGRDLFSRSATLGLDDRSAILDPRFLRRILGPSLIQDSASTGLLCNGSLAVEITAYIGWFKTKKR